MENATKALLIAASILVAILIIGLGVGVYNMASESMGNVNLDQQEMQVHNDKFTGYEGTAVRGSEVNAMLKTVFNHNQAETNASKKVNVYYGTFDATTGVPTKDTSKGDNGYILKSSAKITANDFDTGKTYRVKSTYTKGIITAIYVKQN